MLSNRSVFCSAAGRARALMLVFDDRWRNHLMLPRTTSTAALVMRHAARSCAREQEVASLQAGFFGRVRFAHSSTKTNGWASRRRRARWMPAQPM